MEFLEAATWITISKIILIDILLAGDNAVVIGMAAGKLAPELQKKAVIWGTVGAIGMRLVFATLLVEALTLIPLIHLGGGLVLVWIAIQLLKGGDEDAHIEAKNSLMGAGILFKASTNRNAITRRKIIAPAVPQKIAFFCKCAGRLRAAIPITMALSPANKISITMI
jgi:predicted tellurium resistance membrane protein TerC